MSTVRLTFLYPHLLRAARAGTQPRGVCEISANHRWNTRRSKGTFARRAGKAVEPATFENTSQKDDLKGEDGLQEKDMQPTADSTVAKTEAVKSDAEEPSPPEPQQQPTQGEDKAATAAETKPAFFDELAAAAARSAQPVGAETQNTPSETKPTNSTESSSDSVEASKDGGGIGKVDTEEAKGVPKESSGPLQAVMLMQAPENMPKQHPSMPTPPYVHHFDSYSMVKELEAGGFNRGQATTTMKGIRAILAQNLGVAQDSLVSKSDVENEAYLFQAACSELSTEIANNRRQSNEQIRQKRMHLQNEVDVLTQTLNQELLTLTDDVRGMFNDRKMAVRGEQKGVDSSVQQMNYKISILLTSDAKSEIEGVRWTLIRRSVIGLLFMAILTLGTIRYATFIGKEQQREIQRKKEEEEEVRRNAGKKDHTMDADAAAILSAN